MIRVFRAEGDTLKLLDTLEELNPANDAGWIDLMTPSAEEDRAVENLLQVSIPTREDMDEIELSARLYDDAGAEYMTMLAVAQMQIDDPVKTPVTFILHKNTLITVRYEELTSIAQYIARAKKRGGVPTASAQGIMLGIVESFINRIADSLEMLGGDVDTVSREIFRSKKSLTPQNTDLLQVAIRRIGAKGDLLSMLRESLGSLIRLLLHHQAGMPDGVHKSIRHKAASINRDAASLADHAGFLSGKMSFLLDATLGMINLEQNQIIKIFSIAAVVFLPPTLVASVYGMNFQHMPELNWTYGYPIAVIAMVVSALLPLAYFKKKGWL